MKSMITNEEIPDEEVIFMDGFLYIICRNDEGYSIGVTIIDPQYDETFLTLKDIADRYPYVKKVIHDSYLEGEIYSYGNYKKGEWVQYGTTRGFA